jgi:hypothetical protein
MIEARTTAKVELMQSYAPFKIAQRILATLFAVTYISTYILVIIMTFRGENVDAVKGILQEFQIDWIMLSIVMFYFGGGLAESVMKKK